MFPSEARSPPQTRKASHAYGGPARRARSGAGQPHSLGLIMELSHPIFGIGDRRLPWPAARRLLQIRSEIGLPGRNRPAPTTLRRLSLIQIGRAVVCSSSGGRRCNRRLEPAIAALFHDRGFGGFLRERVDRSKLQNTVLGCNDPRSAPARSRRRSSLPSFLSRATSERTASATVGFPRSCPHRLCRTRPGDEDRPMGIVPMVRAMSSASSLPHGRVIVHSLLCAIMEVCPAVSGRRRQSVSTPILTLGRWHDNACQRQGGRQQQRRHRQALRDGRHGHGRPAPDVFSSLSAAS